MAQMVRLTEYEEARMGFAQGTLDRLNDLVEALTPLKTEFETIFGDVCCGTCAAYECGLTCKETGLPYYLYWNIQDEEGFDSSQDYIYIGYGGVNGTEEEAMEAAKKIVKTLEDRDYKIEWTGSTNSRIRVDLGA